MKKILSVDDSVPTLTLIRETLREDYKVYIMTSGHEALAFLKKQKPDLVLIDFYMPGMDGLETLEEMNKLENFDIPVVMISSVSTKPLEEKCRELGTKAFLSKPFKPEDLKHCVANVLENK